jgi:DNA-binding PadR family transcriptional regulator
MSPAGSSRAEAGRPNEDGRAPAYWLILGLVIEEASHGYEISRRYDARFGDVSPLTISRVYAALDRLRDDGLIEQLAIEEVAETPSRRQLMRRSYRATPAAGEAYRGWLVDQLRDDPLRARLLERVISASGMGIDGLLEVVDRYAQVCLEQMRELPGPAEVESTRGGGLDELAASLLADQQRRELRARYDWAVHARQVLEARSGERAPES